MFLARPDVATLGAALEQLGEIPDVAFSDLGPLAGNGVFGYTHRQRDGRDIYYFGNSSDTPVETRVTLRGRLTGAELWNPHTGDTTPIGDVQHRTGPAGGFTEFTLRVPAVSSMAVVGVLDE